MNRKNFIKKSKKFWSAVARNYDEFLNDMKKIDNLNKDYDKNLKRFVHSLVKKLKPSNVLEIGDCSSVSNIIKRCRKVKNYIGISLVKEPLNRCESFFNISIIGDALEILPVLRSSFFDMIISIYGGFVFCRNIEELVKFSSSLERILSNRGIIIFDTPNYYFYGKKQLLNFKGLELINNLLEPSTILEEVSKHFKILSLYGDHDLSQFSRNSRRLIIVARKLQPTEKLLIKIIKFLHGKETIESIHNKRGEIYTPTESEKLLQNYSFFKINNILGEFPINIKISSILDPKKTGEIKVFQNKIKITGYIYDSTLEDIKRFSKLHKVRIIIDEIPKV